MSDELCLGVDLGTGGLKVALVTLDGAVIDHETHPLHTVLGADGAAEQDANEWWRLVSLSSRRLVERQGVTPGRVRTVAVTGQYASTVPVDARGTPTGPCLTWLDTRGGPYTRRAIGGPLLGYDPRAVARFVRRSGGAPAISGADPVGQMLFLRHECPEITAATRWFMEPVDYLTMRFSATASATHASRLASWLTDNRHLSLLTYDEGLVALVGLDAARLAPLLRLGDVVGTVCPEAAHACALTTDALVVTGVPDLHAAALGSGATRDYETHLALSTTSWISCPVPAKKTDVVHAIAAVPGLSNDSYLIANNQETGARALEWFRTVTGGPTPASFDELTELAALSPNGAHGVHFTPWLAGERSPVDDKGLRAGFTHLATTSTSSDLVRAVLEGVAANSAWLFTHVERFAGRRLDDVRLLGGGAQSDLWCQIYADTLERRVRRVHAPLLAQVRGVTRLAVAALTGDDAREIARRVTDDVFEPRPEGAERGRERVAALRASARHARRRRERAGRGVS